MEIRLRTAEEFRDAHVTIEIRTADQVEFEDVSQALTLTTTSREFNRAELLKARARIDELEGELAGYRKSHVCTERCTKDRHVAFTGRKALDEAHARIDDLKAELGRETAARKAADEARTEMANRILDLKVELDAAVLRGNRNQQWAEQAEAKVTQLQRDLQVEKDRANQSLQRLADIRAITNRRVVDDALDQVTTKVSNTLADAITDIRTVLSSTPDTGTSQA